MNFKDNENMIPDKAESERRKNSIAGSFQSIIHNLVRYEKDYYGDSIERTPERVAKMYWEEMFKGLNPDNYPKVTVQDNTFEYKNMVLECGIEINSCCEHHFVPILGKAHIAYIPSDKVLGLSKLNRIADYFARRPQVQERLTLEIAQDLNKYFKDVAVCIDAIHCCVKMRGIQDSNCVTRTYELTGNFKKSNTLRGEFFNHIPNLKDFKI